MPHTLLLADDSVTIQRVIELTFADEDIRVVAVSDGSQAIAALGRERPDIVLADVGMPGQNGYDVARHIRSTPSLADIPVVLLRGAFEALDQTKVDEVGCDGVLEKPFEPQLVITRVKELLARRKTPAAEAPSSGPSSKEDAAAGASVIAKYFDQLDTALTSQPGAPLENVSEPIKPAAPVASSAPAKPAVSATSRAPSLSAVPPVPAAPAGAQFPPLADAFAALLDAEQSGEPAKPPVWSGSPVAPTLPDDFVDQVTRRVLNQMSDRIVRETVTDIVSKVAERLVKEEIERIKKSIA